MSLEPPDGWFTDLTYAGGAGTPAWGDTGLGAQIDTEHFTTGKQSVRFYADRDPKSFMFRARREPCLPGCTYTASITAMSAVSHTEEEGLPFTLWLSFYESETAESAIDEAKIQDHRAISSMVWSTYSVSAKAPPGACYLQCSIKVGGPFNLGTAFWADSVVVTMANGVILDDSGNVHLRAGAVDGPGLDLIAATGVTKVSTPNWPPLTAERTSTATNTGLGAAQIKHKTSGDMADGFSAAMYFTLEDGAGVENPVARIEGIRAGADGTGDMAFGTYTGGTFYERMRIKSDGKVGIGCNPSYQLHVSSPTATNHMAAGVQAPNLNSGAYVDLAVGTADAADSEVFLGWCHNSTAANRFATIGIGGDNPAAACTITLKRGKVGINVIPATAFHLSGTERIQASGAAGYWDLFHNANGSADYGLVLQRAGTTYLTIGHSTDSVRVMFHNYADNNTGTHYYQGFYNGAGTYTGALATINGVLQVQDSSDERLKRNIKPSAVKGLETLEKIGLIEFNYKTQPENTKPHSIGFSAQNLQEAFPEAVSPTPDGTLGVSRTALIPVLVQAIKELTARVKELEANK